MRHWHADRVEGSGDWIVAGSDSKSANALRASKNGNQASPPCQIQEIPAALMHDDFLAE
jgi:hypothetical protein